MPNFSGAGAGAGAGAGVGADSERSVLVLVYKHDRLSIILMVRIVVCDVWCAGAAQIDVVVGYIKPRSTLQSQPRVPSTY